jgi:hypothetical protein
MGDRYGMQVHAGEEDSASDTNSVSSADTNVPPLNTLLGSSLPDEVDPASPLGQLVRLVQAGVEKSVILAYIKNSPRFFELDADDIIYLTDLGTPPEIIAAVMEHDGQLFEEGIHAGETEPDENAAAVDEQPPEVSLNDFNDTLSPYGTWVYIEGYGRCWRPTVVVYNSSWRPYCDNGRWVYTNNGWYWLSNYSWGWATFHYGRWFRHASYGWCWWPDTVWAPSWVCWRYDNDYYGWAPLPPYTCYRSGVGLVYRGSTVGVGFHFNLTYNCYTFVSARNFCKPYPRRYCVDRHRTKSVYDRTRIHHRYDIDRNRRTITNRGLPVQHVSTTTRQSISPLSIRYTPGRSLQTGRKEALDRNKKYVVVNRSSASGRSNPAGQRSTTSRNTVNPPSTRRPDPAAPSVQSSRSGNSSRSSANRPSTEMRTPDRRSATTPRPTTAQPSRPAQPRSTVTPSPPPSTRQNRSSSGSQRSTQMRQQRPSTQKAPPAKKQVRPAPSRPATPPRVQAGARPPQPAPQVSRKPVRPGTASVPSQSSRNGAPKNRR